MKDEFFEPVTFRLAALSENVAGWLILPIGLLVLVITTWRLSLGLPYVVALMLLACGGMIGVRFVLPIYCRIVPRRLDILRFGLFRWRLKSAESFDLDSARIICRFDQGKIQITTEQQSEHGSVNEANREQAVRRTTLVLADVLRPHEFARWLFQGAISTHKAPALPMDELIA